jgi:hypothetical protein
MTKRIGQTKNGEQVYLNELSKVEGGWEGYVLNSHGVAVLVFIPE